MWSSALAYTAALASRAPLELVASDGRAVALDVGRWLADADAADRSVLARCAGPVLDVGCGPGRMVRACRAGGMDALGVDVARDAVALSNARGGPALLLDVFAALPAEGRWRTVLLLDGNIGIGGDVSRLLARTRELLARDGAVVVEVLPGASTERRMRVRMRVDGVAHPGDRPFPWAVVGASGLLECAAAARLRARDHWRVDGRQFLRLGRA